VVRPFDEAIQAVVQSLISENNLLNAGQFGIHARHSMRLTDHMPLNYNNSQSMPGVFLDI
jgi:hypothetical protein